MKTLKNFYWMVRYIKMDWSRYTGHLWNPFVLVWNLFYQPGMMFSLLYRIERFLLYESTLIGRIMGYILYPLYYFLTYYVLSYHIEPRTAIGPGLFLHNRDIVITEAVTIGKYFTCMGQVTIGKNFFHKTHITIGDNVFVGAGVKIIGTDKVQIASGVIIGANAVVTKSLEKECGVFAGIPAVLKKIHKYPLATWNIH